jgi:putative colanic acid biosynthesis acetyltransferase WcaF
MPQLDIRACRSARRYTCREYASRGLWGVVQATLFRLSPRWVWQWRVLLLRLFGARIGSGAHINPSARVFAPWELTVGDDVSIGDDAKIYNVGHITLGDRVIVSQGAHLCAGSHDYTDPAMPLQRTPIVVEDDVWICAEAFIGPHVRVGARSVVGARAVVAQEVGVDVVVAGNPARVIKPRELRPRP